MCASYLIYINVWTAKDCAHLSEDSMPNPWEDGPQNVRTLPYRYKKCSWKDMYGPQKVVRIFWRTLCSKKKNPGRMELNMCASFKPCVMVYGPQKIARIFLRALCSICHVSTARVCAHLLEDSMLNSWQDGPQHVRILLNFVQKLIMRGPQGTARISWRTLC